jgi:hypothetical protein
VLGLLTVAAFSVINRIRGGLFTLPVDTKLVAAPLAGAWAYLLQLQVSAPFLTVTWHPHLVGAVAFGLCWLIWAYPPWSRWMTLGFVPMTIKAPTAFESAIESISFGQVWVAWFWRQFLCLIPMAIVFHDHWWTFGIWMPFAYWLSYLIGWECYENSSFKPEPIGLSEWIGGACWGIAMVVAAGL